MVLFRGVADDLKLMDWLQQLHLPGRGEERHRRLREGGTRLAALEMIRSGTTTFVDMYYFEDQVAEAAKEAGPARRGRRDADRASPPPTTRRSPEALAYTERFLKRWAGDPLIVPRWRPHSTYLCQPRDAQGRARPWPTATARRS